MKIALVHDYIKEYGGAERVLETLHEMFPKAPVYTLIYAPDYLGPHKERFYNWDIRPSFLQVFPFSYKFISWFRILAPFVFSSMDLSEYDAVIVSATGAYNPNLIKTKKKMPKQLVYERKGAYHICYCHTPPRYLYGFATARESSKNPVAKVLLAMMIHVLRIVDALSSKNVDLFIANSENVRSRIQKFYRKDAKVIYPPVDIQEIQDSGSKIQEEKREYFLTGGRLARPKHVDLIVKACTELKLPLKVFGKSFAGYGKSLEKMAGKTVEFLGEISDSEKIKLMQGAKAFIFASEDEDFGIVPVEAMGCGTPVIAYRSGGVVESVVENKTGIFFDELTVTSVMGAIQKFQKAKISPKNCAEQAKKFAKEEFIKQIQKVVNNI